MVDLPDASRSHDRPSAGLLGDPDRSAIRAIAAALPLGAVIATVPEGVIALANPVVAGLTGEPVAAIEGRSLERFCEDLNVVPADTRGRASSRDFPLARAALLGEVIRGEEWLAEGADGVARRLVCDAAPICEPGGKRIGGILIWAEGRGPSVEDELRYALAQRDDRLAELQHRIRNHIQLITAMIRIESRRADAELDDVVETMERRLSALGAAYAALQDRDDEGVPAHSLLASVCEPLVREGVGIDTAADPDLFIPARSIAALGIIVNEAVCNAIKHGFPGGRTGAITVSLKRSGAEVELLVRDDGAGLDAGTVSARGEGSRLIAHLARQFGGSTSLTRRASGGTQFAMTIARLR